MKFLLVLLTALLSTSAFAGSFQVRKTMRLIGFDQNKTGSIIIANTAEKTEALKSQLPFSVDAESKLVIITGKTAIQFQAILEDNGHQVQLIDEGGNNPILVFSDNHADMMIKIIKHYYGEMTEVTEDGLVILKGGLEELAAFVMQVLNGSIEIGVEVVQIVAQFALIHFEAVVKLAKRLLEHAGKFLLMTAQHVVLVLKFAAGEICKVLKVVFGHTLIVVKRSIECAVKVVGRAAEIVTHILDEIFGGEFTLRNRVVIAN